MFDHPSDGNEWSSDGGAEIPDRQRSIYRPVRGFLPVSSRTGDGCGCSHARRLRARKLSYGRVPLDDPAGTVTVVGNFAGLLSFACTWTTMPPASTGFASVTP